MSYSYNRSINSFTQYTANYNASPFWKIKNKRIETNVIYLEKMFLRAIDLQTVPAHGDCRRIFWNKGRENHDECQFTSSLNHNRGTASGRYISTLPFCHISRVVIGVYMISFFSLRNKKKLEKEKKEKLVKTCSLRSPTAVRCHETSRVSKEQTCTTFLVRTYQQSFSSTCGG